jgi:hypothetical protein
VSREVRALDFGFEPERSPAHFAVIIEEGDDARVTIEERFACEDTADARPAQRKVTLDAYRWSRIADQARGQFNRRLRDANLPAGKWKSPGETLLAPHLGKELTLLAWAVEESDPTLIPNMVANWLGLAPEERWWLYTTINATAGHPEHGRERGWRKAIKVAFAENPSGAPPETLVEAGHEGVRLPLPPEFDAVRTQPDAARELPDHVARTVEAQLERRPRRGKPRAQMALLPEDER